LRHLSEARTASAHPVWHSCPMQASGLQHAHPRFVDHTPRHFDITVLSPSHPPEMFGPAGMALPSVMGQLPSATEVESVRKPSTTSTTIVREYSIHVEEEGVSRPDSWSMHYDSTDQAPYAVPEDDKMMTSTNILHVPKENPSHDLAFFLRTTGPTAPHRRPSKVEHQRRAIVAPQRALRFLRIGQRRLSAVRTGHDKWVSRMSTSTTLQPADRSRFNGVLRDEGRLLRDIAEESSIPHGVEQKQTLTGA